MQLQDTNLKRTPGDGKSGISRMASDNCLIRSDSHMVSTVKNTVHSYTS